MKSKKILCCFPLETISRDLDPRLHLGLQCIKEGYSCLIGSKGGVAKEMFKQNMPFIYFDKSLDASAENFYRNIKMSKGTIVSLDEEGGVFNEKLYKSELLRRNGENILKYVDLFFTWGKKQKKILVENTSIAEKKIIVSGHPRFDLCKPKFKEFRLALLKNHIDTKNKYILINSTFTAANTFLSFDEEIKLRIDERGDDSLDVKYERKLYDYRKLLINYFYEAIKEINRIYPELTIIFRPHPGENGEYYKRLFQKLKNVIVTGDGSAQEWISESCMVLHHDCTTAVEAFFSEKFIISYCPIKDDDFVQSLPIEISSVVANQDHLLKLISNAQDFSIEKEQKKIACNYIRPIIANVDFESAEIIVKSLRNIAIESSEIPKFNIGIFIKATIRKFIKILKRDLNFSSFSKNKLKIRQNLKFPGLNKKEIEERISLLRKIDKDLPDVKIEQISENTFLLS